MNYFKKSFGKFKQDALSKLFYDLSKWFILATSVFAATKFLPKGTSIGDILAKKVSGTLYSALLIGLILIVIAILIVTFLFNKKYKELKRDNFTDELTGLKNHKAFKEYLAEKLNSVKGTNKTFSIIIIDVDDFKNFNTKFNTNFADKVLSKLGELLGNDKRITDEAFRQFLRGDEFVIIANDTNLNDAIRAAERKRTLIESTTFVVDDASCNLTVSCGVTEVKKDKDDFKTITDRANQALLEAKSKAGKNNTKSII